MISAGVLHDTDNSGLMSVPVAVFSIPRGPFFRGSFFSRAALGGGYCEDPKRRMSRVARRVVGGPPQCGAS